MKVKFLLRFLELFMNSMKRFMKLIIKNLKTHVLKPKSGGLKNMAPLKVLILI